MSGMIKFGIIAASLCFTVTLMWGTAYLAMLSTLWFGEHPEVAKAMQLLPVFVLPIVAVAIYRRRSRSMVRYFVGYIASSPAPASGDNYKSDLMQNF